MPKKSKQKLQAKPKKLSHEELLHLAKKVVLKVNKILPPLVLFSKSDIKIISEGNVNKALFYYKLEGAPAPHIEKNALALLKKSFKGSIEDICGCAMEVEFLLLEVPVSLMQKKLVLRFFNQMTMQLNSQEQKKVQLLQQIQQLHRVKKEMEEKEEEIDLDIGFVMACFNTFILQSSVSVNINEAINVVSSQPEVNIFMEKYRQEVDKFTAHLKKCEEMINFLDDLYVLFFPNVSKAEENFFSALLDMLDSIPAGKKRWFEVRKYMAVLDDLLEGFQNIKIDLQRSFVCLEKYGITLKKIESCLEGFSSEDLRKLGLQEVIEELESEENIFELVGQNYDVFMQDIQIYKAGCSKKLEALIEYDKKCLVTKAKPLKVARRFSSPRLFGEAHNEVVREVPGISLTVEMQQAAQVALEKKARKEELRQSRASAAERDEKNVEEVFSESDEDIQERDMRFCFSFQENLLSPKTHPISCKKVSGTENIYISSSPIDPHLLGHPLWKDFVSTIEKGNILRRDGLGKNGMKIYSDTLLVVKISTGDRLVCASKKVEEREALVYVPVKIMDHKAYMRLMEPQMQMAGLGTAIDNLQLFSLDSESTAPSHGALC